MSTIGSVFTTLNSVQRIHGGVKFDIDAATRAIKLIRASFWKYASTSLKPRLLPSFNELQYFSKQSERGLYLLSTEVTQKDNTIHCIPAAILTSVGVWPTRAAEVYENISANEIKETQTKYQARLGLDSNATSLTKSISWSIPDRFIFPDNQDSLFTKEHTGKLSFFITPITRIDNKRLHQPSLRNCPLTEEETCKILREVDAGAIINYSVKNFLLSF